MYSDECYPGNVCFAQKAGATPTCQAVGSQVSGGPCTQEACGADLACPASGNMTCQSVVPNIETCTNATKDCSVSGASCECSHFVAEAFCTSPLYDPCTSEQIDLTQCMVTNKCIVEAETPGSCCQNGCSSEYKKLRQCLCSIVKETIGSCWYDTYCGGFPVWAIIVIIVAVIALILGVVAVVIFYMRQKRRRQYESI